MPQPDLFPLMTLEAFQAYANFWFAQAQAQTEVGKRQYPVPPTTTYAQPLTHTWVKLSKLVKKARQLSCETFSGSIDAIMARSWLKRIFDTLTDMELDDELKVRVATRLIDKSAAT